MSIVLDGTSGITTPALDSTAKFATADMPLGSVLQVVNATYATNTQTTSGTYTDTGLSASITPSSASNKVLVIVHMQGSSNTSSNSYLGLQVLRGATVIVGLQNAAFYAGGNTRATISTCYLDSPATTSSTTYKVQMKSPAGGSVSISADGASDVNTITLMEIAA